MGSIWAVAVNTIKQAARMKIAIVFIVLLVVLLPLMALTSTGDGTAMGKLKTFMSYGLSLTSMLLSLLTIFITTYTLSSDLDQRQVFTVLTKPLRRWQYLLGKMLGVVVINVVLLAWAAGGIYYYLQMAPRYWDLDQDQVSELNDQFFTARTSLNPRPETIDPRAVEQRYQQLETYGQLDEFTERGYAKPAIKDKIQKMMQLEQRAAAQGQEISWSFNKLPRFEDPNDCLFVRFKYELSVPGGEWQVSSRWLAGDLRQMRSDKPATTPIYPHQRKDPPRTAREFAIPASVVAQDGHLDIAFMNMPTNRFSVIFPLEDGMQLLYKADTFGWNYLRGVLLILFRLVFLSCLGVFAATFLSFPVAILLSLVVYFTSTVSGFIQESFGYLSQGVGAVYDSTVGLMIKALPQFDAYNPSQLLVKSTFISWSLIAKVLLTMVCIKALLLVVIGLWVFSKRELAQTSN